MAQTDTEMTSAASDNEEENPEVTKDLWVVAYQRLKEADASSLAEYEELTERAMPRRSSSMAFRRLGRRQTRHLPVSPAARAWLWEDDGLGTGEIASELRSLKSQIVSSIEAFPDAHIAWTAVCLGIKKSLDPLSSPKTREVAYIASRMQLYARLPRLLDRDAGETGDLYESLIGLFHAILKVLVYATLSKIDEDEDEGDGISPIVKRERELSTCPEYHDMEDQIYRLFEAVEEWRQESREDEETRDSNVQDDLKDSTSEKSPTRESENEPEKELNKSVSRLLCASACQCPISSGNYLDAGYQWIINKPEYKEWEEEECEKSESEKGESEKKESCCLLWVTGDDAVGNTALMNSIVKKMEVKASLLSKTAETTEGKKVERKKDKASSRIAYAFCHWTCDPKHWSVASVIKSLIAAVVDAQSDLESHVRNALRDANRQAFSNEDGLGDLDDPSCDFYAMLALLSRIVTDPSFQPTCFVVNGLEELCRDEDGNADFESSDPFSATWTIRDLIQLMWTTCWHSSKVTWIVSSTDERMVKISEGMAEALSSLYFYTVPDAKLYTQRHIHLSPNDVTLDSVVQAYQSELVAALGENPVYTTSMLGRVDRLLAKKSHRNMTWIRLAQEELKKAHLPWSAPRILEDMGENLQSLYARTGTRIDRFEDDRDKKNCRALLEILAAAFRPMTVYELQDLAAISDDVDVRIMVSELCWPLLECNADGSHVYFSNLSMRDFQRQHIGWPDMRSSSHADMVERCLAYLEKIYAQTNDTDAEENERGAHYALLSWVRHLAQIDCISGLENIEKKVQRFMNQHFIEWLTHLKKMHRLDTAKAQMSLFVGECSKQFSCTTALFNCALDVVSMALHAPLEEVCRFVLLTGGVEENPLLASWAQTVDFPIRPQGPSLMLRKTMRHYIFTLNGHSDWVRGCCWTLGGRLIASSSDDYTVRLWDRRSGRVQHVVKDEFYNYLYSIDSSPVHPGLLITTNKYEVAFIDVFSGITKRTLSHSELASKLDLPSLSFIESRFSPGGDILVTVGEETEYVLKMPFFKSEDPRPVSMKRTRISCENGEPSETIEPFTITAWDDGNNEIKVTVPYEIDFSDSMAFSTHASIFALAKLDGQVQIRDIKTGELLQTLQTGQEVERLLFSPSGRVLISVLDKTVWLWRSSRAAGQPQGPDDFTLWRVYSSHRRLLNLAFAPSGRELLMSDSDADVSVWDADYHGSTCGLDGQGYKRVSAVAISHDGRHVASTSRGTITLWDAHSRAQVRKINSEDSEANSLRFSNSDELLLACYDNGGAGVFHAATGERKLTITRHKDWARMAVFSADDRLIATASDDYRACTWIVDGEYGTVADDKVEKVAHLEEFEHDLYVHSVAFSPDTRFLATTARFVHVWELGVGSKTPRILKHEDDVEDAGKDFTVYGVVFSSDKKVLLSSSYNDRFDLWSTDTWKSIGIIKSNLIGPGSYPSFNLSLLNMGNHYLFSTEIGTWELSLGTDDSTDATISLSPENPYSIYKDDDEATFLSRNGQIMCRFPKRYSPATCLSMVCCNVRGNTVVIGLGSGAIIIYRFEEKE